jgi:hypothetical protein
MLFETSKFSKRQKIGDKYACGGLRSSGVRNAITLRVTSNSQ